MGGQDMDGAEMTDADEQARAELDLRRIFTAPQLTQIVSKLWRAIQHSDDCDQSVTLVFKHGHFAFVNGTENEKAIKPKDEQSNS
jgi:hypothetical protein